MSIPVGNLVEFAVGGEIYGQTWMNTWHYKAVIWPGGVTAEQAAEAYWDHVKTTYRALFSSDFANAFLFVKSRDMDDNTGDYASYGVPLGERIGTRTPPSGDPAPPFLAAGVRLNVGTRVTRPGQKRIAGMYDADTNTGYLASGYVTLVDNLMAVAANGVVLGAPAATVSLDPVVVRRSPSTGLPTAHQVITSYTVSAVTTSQNTRKIGRGI